MSAHQHNVLIIHDDSLESAVSTRALVFNIMERHEVPTDLLSEIHVGVNGGTTIMVASTDSKIGWPPYDKHLAALKE